MNTQNQNNNQQKVLPPNMTFSSEKAKERAIKNQIALMTFVDDLIKEINDPEVNEKNIIEVRTVILKELNDAINRHLISLLTKKDQEDLSALLDKNPPDDVIDDFFVQRIPNFESEVAAVLINFKAAYLYTFKNRQREKASVDHSKENSNLPPAPPAPAPVKNFN